MMLRFAATSLLLAAGVAAQPCGDRGDSKNMVVSTAWLASHLQDANLSILAVGDKAEYDRGHIPGAVFLRFGDLADKRSPLNLELPPVADLTTTFRDLGVADGKRIVIYIQGGRAIQATRTWLTLDAMGLGGHASILDGGMTAWQSEGRPASADTPEIRRGNLTPCPRTDVIVDSSYVSSNVKHRGVDIVDARDPLYYSGESTANGKRAGHIPGAANLPFGTLTDAQGKFYAPETLRAMFSRAGIEPGDRVVSYCHIGLQATMVYFTARYLGYDARLYDGSWEDWSAHKELPAETGAQH